MFTFSSTCRNQKCFHIRAALDGPLLLRPVATWQGRTGGWDGEGAGDGWEGFPCLERELLAGHWAYTCLHYAVILHPAIPSNGLGSQSKPTRSKFSKTASMMARKSSLPPSPSQSKRGNRGVISKGLVLGNVRAFVILNSVPRWEKAAPSFLGNNFGSIPY